MPNEQTRKSNTTRSGGKSNVATTGNSNQKSKTAGEKRRKLQYRQRRRVQRNTNRGLARPDQIVSSGFGLSGSVGGKRKGSSNVLPLPQHGSITYTKPSSKTSSTVQGYASVKGSTDKSEIIGSTTTVATTDQVIQINTPNYFRDFAVGIYKRARRCRIALCANETTPYDISHINLGADSTGAIMVLTNYLHYVYRLIDEDQSAIPAIPRNIAFMFRLLGRNNYLVAEGKKTMHKIILNGYVEPNHEVRALCASLIEAPRMGYDVVTCIPKHCKPFVTTHKIGASQTARHPFVVYDADDIGSVRCVYQSNGDLTKYISTSKAAVTGAHWPLICASAFDGDQAENYDGHTDTTVAIEPRVLRQYIAYEDCLFDAMYIFGTSNGDDTQKVSKYSAEFANIMSAIALTQGFKDVYAPAQLSKLDEVIAFARMVYAPFLSVVDSDDNGDWTSFALCASFRGPVYLPSIIHESIIGNTSACTLSLRLNTGSWRGIIFHYSNVANIKITVANINAYITFSQSLLRARNFAKVNHVPETTPSQAFIPSFFIRSLDAAGDEVVRTPYSYTYIEHHNLTALATCLWWPTLSVYSNGILSSLSIVAQITKDSIPAQRAMLVDFIFDYSFMADSSEIDHYLYKIRINYLGLFGFLKGIANKVKNVGATIMNKVVKPILSNPLVQTVAHVAGTALGGPMIGNMIDAGISMISSSPPGDPSVEHITDLAEGQA